MASGQIVQLSIRRVLQSTIAESLEGLPEIDASVVEGSSDDYTLNTERFQCQQGQ